MFQIPLSDQLHPRRLLIAYSYYSVFLSLTAFGLVVLDDQMHFFKAGDSLFLGIVCAGYVVSGLAFAGMTRMVADQHKVISYFFIEIVLLIILMTSAGGLQNSIATLLLIPVFIANLLATGVLGYAVAAWTALGILATQHILQSNDQAHHMINSGTYGFLCFILAFLTQSISKRLDSALEIANVNERLARRTRKLSLHALKELPSGVLACDINNMVIFSNQIAEQRLGLTGGNPLPAYMSDLFEQQEGKKQIGLDGHQYSIRKVTLIDSEPGDYLLYIVDQSKIAAEAQQLKLASLGRLTASIAHEIRNPLSALRQASQLLAETEYLEAPEKHLTEILEQHCMRINRTVEDILQLSRKRQPIIETLRLQPWLSHFATQFREQNKDHTFQIQTDCPESVLACIDPDHLQQILHNLCGNGLRYALSESGENAQISLTAGRYDHQRVFLDILDNGTGIDEEKQRHLFEPFFTTEHNGTGLGLYLSRELCEANGASISTRQVSSGTCFRILLTMDAS